MIEIIFLTQLGAEPWSILGLIRRVLKSIRALTGNIEAIENVFHVCIAWYKHERGWRIRDSLCQRETKSRVCITIENSPSPWSVYIRLCKHRKKVFYCFYKITFPRKNAKLFVMAMIKRRILTSRKVLYTKTSNQFLFCKKMLSKIWIFLAQNVSLSEKKLTQRVCKDFPSFSWRRNG